MGFDSTLELPYPRLVEGRFASIDALTDEALFDACGVRVAFTLRGGGVSAAPYDSLNLGDHVGDDLDCVARNRELLLSAFGVQHATAINPLQVHGDRIVAVEHMQDAGSAARSAREGADAVAVLCDDVAALLCFADCMPVVAVAPNGCFAVVHAGWRGVENRIAAEALRLLADRTGADPASFNIYLGPHIRSCHFEVAPDLAQRFASSFGEHVVVRDAGGLHVDLARAMRIQLEECGADCRRILDAGICTVCSQDRFFSYRGSGGTCGRHAAFAVRPSGAGSRPVSIQER